MAVVDVGIRNHVDKFAGLQARDLGHQVGEHRVLAYVPVVGGQHVLGALVQNGVEAAARHVEGHGIGAGVQGHLA